MKSGSLARTAIILIVSALSVVAAAQNQPEQPQRSLDLPSDVQFVGKQDPGVRKATAIVGGEVITGSDIDQRLALVVVSNQIRLPAEEVERFRAQILRNLIDETLQIQEAARHEITIDEREINQYYERFAQNFRQTPDQLNAYLRSIGSSERSMKRQIRGEMAWTRLLRRQIEPFVNVGEEEVQAVIRRLEAQRGNAEYRVSEIFMSATPETAAQVRANAERIVQQVQSGASFAAYARQYSEASTAAVGGDLGWVSAGQLPDELAAMVTQMPVGAVSAPIEIAGGYSIVLLADSRQVLVADARDAVFSLMQLSIALPPGTPQAQMETRARQLGEATQRMGGCGGAQATAQTLGAELIQNDQVRARELPPALQRMMLALSVGQATTPFGGGDQISVLVLCGRDDPPAANAPSPDDVQERLTQERVTRRAQRYLRDLRRDAVIDYR